MLQSGGRWPRLLGPGFPAFPPGTSESSPSYPPLGSLARMGVLALIFVPVLGLILLWPSLVSTPAHARQQETGETSLLRLDPGSLTNRGGRPPSAEVDALPLETGARPEVEIYLHMRGASYPLRASGSDLREGLAHAGIFPKPSDLLQPQMDTPLHDGIHAYLQESLPVIVYADGGIASGYTLRATVGQALAELGVELGGHDLVQPSIESLVIAPTTVKVVRIAEELITEEEIVEYQVLRQASDELEINTQALAQEGEDGLLKRTISISYEDGQEVGRSLVEEWMEKEPTPKVILSGTKVIWRALETPSGPVSYREKLRMMATSYDASHGGKAPGSPAYGITYTGMRAGRGVVAVDPRVIPLYTRLYIPGYGLAVAGDTGGAIKGDRIDLGFEEGATGLWSSRWVDVYILNR